MHSLSSSPPGSRDLLLVLGPLLLGVALASLAFLLVLRPFGCSSDPVATTPRAELDDDAPWLLGLSRELASGDGRHSARSGD